MAVFAPRRRFPVRAIVNGHAYRTTVVDMGDGPCFGVNKAIREAAGIARGDRIDVTIELDREERTVEVPPYIARALGTRLRAVYDGMSYTLRKEYVMWIEDAKLPETRKRRIQKVLHALRQRAATRKRR